MPKTIDREGHAAPPPAPSEQGDGQEARTEAERGAASIPRGSDEESGQGRGTGAGDQGAQEQSERAGRR